MTSLVIFASALKEPNVTNPLSVHGADDTGGILSIGV